MSLLKIEVVPHCLQRFGALQTGPGIIEVNQVSLPGRGRGVTLGDIGDVRSSLHANIQSSVHCAAGVFMLSHASLRIA